MDLVNWIYHLRLYPLAISSLKATSFKINNAKILTLLLSPANYLACFVFILVELHCWLTGPQWNDAVLCPLTLSRRLISVTTVGELASQEVSSKGGT